MKFMSPRYNGGKLMRIFIYGIVALCVDVAIVVVGYIPEDVLAMKYLYIDDKTIVGNVYKLLEG